MFLIVAHIPKIVPFIFIMSVTVSALAREQSKEVFIHYSPEVLLINKNVLLLRMLLTNILILM